MAISLTSPAANASEGSLSRRTLLKLTAASGGGLLFGFRIPLIRAARAAAPVVPSFAPNAFLRIDRAGDVVMTIPQVEMGQGIYTSLAMILAEELDADFGRVSVVAAPPDDALYANPILHFQVTGGSTSIRAFWMPMRRAGSGARALLVGAAARQ